MSPTPYQSLEFFLRKKWCSVSHIKNFNSVQSNMQQEIKTRKKNLLK